MHQASASAIMPQSKHLVTLLIGTFLVPAALRASSLQFQWIAPTPAELAMTAEPKAPGASAIILSYDEQDDNTSYEELVHIRIKVLNEAGLSAATVDVPAIIDAHHFNKNFFARTIHPDGTILPFVSDFSNTHVEKERKTETGRTAALPGVTVGSIIEYGYHIPWDAHTYSWDQVWFVQRDYFVRSAHFTLKVSPNYMDATRWVAKLPDGVPIRRNKDTLSLDVSDIPAIPDEDLTPPLISYVYNVRFFTWGFPTNTFWSNTATSRNIYWTNFYGDKKHLAEIARQIAPPSDNEDVRLRKIYDAVQQMENTDLTRVRSEREDKREGFKQVKNAEDIWNRKRGDSQDLTLLFIALARGSGFNAYPMAVASRDRTIFSLDVLDWWQMDSMIAVVPLKGTEFFFDPGTRRCPFGYLAPWHSNSSGVSDDGKRIEFRSTPDAPAKASHIIRTADLTIDAEGNLTGTLKISWYALAGLRLRRLAVIEDEESVRTQFEHELQADLPTGVDVKLQSLEGLANPDSLLLANLTVSGKLGVATAKRLIIPAQFFASTAKPLFAAGTRTFPIAFPGTAMKSDEVTLHLPPGLSVETLPQSLSIKLGGDNATYTVRLQAPSPGKPYLVTQRVSVLNRINYSPTSYGPLHTYYSKIAECDSDQIVLQTVPLAASK